MAAARSPENHFLALVVPSLRKHADAPVFRPYEGQGDVDAWGTLTYRELEHRLAFARAHWKRALEPLNLSQGDVIGLWLTGKRITDTITGLAISALGFVPQFFSSVFDNADVIFALLARGNAKALVYAPAFASAATANTTMPALPAIDEAELARAIAAATPAELTFEGPFPAVSPSDNAVLFHSSGSTGGMPKIIPNTFAMLRAVVAHKWQGAMAPHPPGRMAINTLGNLAHVGTFHMLLGCAHVGDCVAQASAKNISAAEFVAMARACSLNTLTLYGTYLSMLVRASRTDAEVRKAFADVGRVIFTGASMVREDEEWARENGISITSVYSSTETAPLLMTEPGSQLMRPIPGAHPEFVPFGGGSVNGDGDADTSGRALFECTVPAGAPDCPPPPFVGPDGRYHTNDLFERVEDGWAYRGRGNDWLKMGDTFVDTKSIEDMVRGTCEDIVHDAVVVGQRWAAPALIVESAKAGLDEEARARVAKEIVERTAAQQARAFPHERILDPARVLVVEKGALPRTEEKHNVRRPAAEEQFAEYFNKVFGKA